MLQLDKKKRGQEDLDILIHMLSKTKFFQERNLSEKLVNMLVYDMKYQFVPQDQIIFEFGISIIYIYRFIWILILLHTRRESKC